MMVFKPTNPQRDYRKGTMYGNLKAWEKDMEVPRKDQSGHSMEPLIEPKLKGRFAPPKKPALSFGEAASRFSKGKGKPIK